MNAISPIAAAALDRQQATHDRIAVAAILKHRKLLGEAVLQLEPAEQMQIVRAMGNQWRNDRYAPASDRDHGTTLLTVAQEWESDQDERDQPDPRDTPDTRDPSLRLDAARLGWAE